MGNENQTKNKESELKKNAVAVAKTGGAMVFVFALFFLFFLVSLFVWMANP
jgi:hypothetical protein